jgi:hydrogenase maturation protease
MDVNTRNVLVAGVGNVLLGDDGFGVAVARLLMKRTWPAGVHVREFGIRGIDFLYALSDGYGTAILVDAVSCGGQPGRLYVIEPGMAPAPATGPFAFDPHRLDPVQVMDFVRATGARLGSLRVVGCEPARLMGDDGLTMELSEPVQAAVEPAVELVASLVERAVHFAEGSVQHA